MPQTKVTIAETNIPFAITGMYPFTLCREFIANIQYLERYIL